MKYIKISYLDFPTIRTNYTFFLELYDNSFTGEGVAEIPKEYGPKEYGILPEWAKNARIKFSDNEIEKYKISKDEFMMAIQRANRDQRKNKN